MLPSGAKLPFLQGIGSSVLTGHLKKREIPVEFVRRIENCGHVRWWDVSAASALPIPGAEGEVKWWRSENFGNAPQRYSWSTHTHIHHGISPYIVDNLTCLTWTPINGSKTKFFLVQATDPKLPLTRTQKNIFSSLCCNKLDDMAT